MILGEKFDDAIQKLNELEESLTVRDFFYNGQYVPIDIRTYRDSHDRFLVVDEMDVYHIGASLKDLGKKNVRLLKTEYSCNSDY